ncbi:hypothetical protein HGRIS_011047 [Hohenbuehelia grisea]|uniref:G domain-containing protein n=1 Tax=Hohenbuehelia grisea TaxID=104357 RepID=A0ABR3IZ28_9AGAR
MSSLQFLKEAAPIGGRGVKVGHGLAICTKKVTPVEVSDIAISSSRIILVDTPALNPDGDVAINIVSYLGKWMRKATNANLKVAGLLYFHRITDPRLNEKFTTHHDALRRMLPSDDKYKALLVTTMWDDAYGDSEHYEDRERELRDNWQRIGPSQSVVKFRKSQESAREVVRYLLTLNL